MALFALKFSRNITRGNPKGKKHYFVIQDETKNQKKKTFASFP
ncbi:hypothetical protein P872_12260 [Rhodonellum psychrophilum GCM71 = DSM 17998]|uniref:Uncharacterized protein n=1 Tax=Rhodonellum psychrophilum GCM71 = DSM 17998 TaxID=1123057 RepID=U5BU29_9BACT|nr:hypothetical protein P872_12260 [Rhodonellum psychrophilum GCM71 = DSM 17998]